MAIPDFLKRMAAVLYDDAGTPLRSDASNNLQVTLGTALSGAVDSVQTEGKLVTYWAAANWIPVGNAATDVWAMVGSSSKTAKLRRLRGFAMAPIPTTSVLTLIKRALANSAGSFVAVTAVPADSTDPASTLTAFGTYFANPTTLGTLGTTGGVIRGWRGIVPASNAASTNAPAVFDWVFGDAGDKPPNLRSANEVFALNVNSAASLNLLVESTWTEE
jgi:hypothetical protein